MAKTENLREQWDLWVREASALLGDQERQRLYELFESLFAVPVVGTQEAVVRRYLWLVWSQSLESSETPAEMMDTPVQELLPTVPMAPDASPRQILSQQREIVESFALWLQNKGLVRCQEKAEELTLTGDPLSLRLLHVDQAFWDEPTRGECLVDPLQDPRCLPPSWKPQ